MNHSAERYKQIFPECSKRRICTSNYDRPSLHEADTHSSSNEDEKCNFIWYHLRSKYYMPCPISLCNVLSDRKYVADKLQDQHCFRFRLTTDFSWDFWRTESWHNLSTCSWKERKKAGVQTVMRFSERERAAKKSQGFTERRASGNFHVL